MAQKTINKKVLIVKTLLVVVLAALCGITCLFAPTIEKALNLGTKAASLVAKEQITGDLKVHFLDVDQADCTFIELPNGETVMIDAGSPKKDSAKIIQHIIDYVKDLNVSVIDYFILTHSDEDHVLGAAKIFEAFEIKNVIRPFQIALTSGGDIAEGEMLGSYYTPGSKTVSTSTTGAYRDFIKAAYSEQYIEGGVKKPAKVYVAYDGLTLPMEGSAEFSFEFFAPLISDNTAFSEDTLTIGYPTKYYSKANNASPIILLEYNETSFVFTGDAESKVEEDFLKSLTDDEEARFKNVDLMQAGHHGSDTSNTEEFIKLLAPNYFVASAGKGNKYGHPNEGVIDRINSYPHTVSDYLLITYESKDIMFGFDKDGTLMYAAFAGGNGTVIRWYHIALSIFVVGTVIIISVKVSKNKETTFKNIIKETNKAVKKYK